MEDKTWDSINKEFIEMPKEMREFIADIIKVYEKYGLSIGHEDGHGAFEIERFETYNVDWLKHSHKYY